ncbi:urease accessory protein UreF [Marimonas lutisalis]|uniref:urease accessory protein UreF n=1 Tax=Marimonas lutisalis TaxID=2545756 RepID=UPI0010FA4904|nr:urease accessory UreF family protein [Marimonas lutisalis]
MSPDHRLLTLAQWASPGYPTGAFAYSHGLEAAIRAGWVKDAGTLRLWLRALLAHGSARSEAVWLGLGYRAGSAAALEELDALAAAFAATRERLRESRRQGAAFRQVTNAVWGFDLPEVMLPLAFGQAAHRAGIDLAPAAIVFVQAFVANLVSAAVRLVPLGQTEGQQVIASLAAACAALGKVAEAATRDDIFSNAFLSDIAAMQHENLEPRLFQT